MQSKILLLLTLFIATLSVRSAVGYCVKCEDWVEIYYPSKYCPKCGKKILDSWPSAVSNVTV